MDSPGWPDERARKFRERSRPILTRAGETRRSFLTFFRPVTGISRAGRGRGTAALPVSCAPDDPDGCTQSVAPCVGVMLYEVRFSHRGSATHRATLRS